MVLNGTLGSNVGLDILEGNYVYFQRGEFSWFRNWEDLTSEQQQEAIRHKQHMSDALDTVSKFLPNEHSD